VDLLTQLPVCLLATIYQDIKDSVLRLARRNSMSYFGASRFHLLLSASIYFCQFLLAHVIT